MHALDDALLVQPVPCVAARGRAIVAGVWVCADATRLRWPAHAPLAPEQPLPMLAPITSQPTHLWLRLDDGEVRAWRLPPLSADELEPVLALLIGQCVDDPRGKAIHLRLPDRPNAVPLHNAPLQPRPVENASLPPAVIAALVPWLAGLDHAIITALRALHDWHDLATVDNYRRLRRLAPLHRDRWLQALQRYPALLAAPLLASIEPAHLAGGRQNRLREPAAPMRHAIEQGRDLTGALAAHCGISRSLVRSPLWRQPWPPRVPAAPALLPLLDAMPAHVRPQSTDALLQARGLLRYLLLVFAEDGAGLRTFTSRWLRDGLEACLQRLAPFGDLDAVNGDAWRDAEDFLAALLRALPTLVTGPPLQVSAALLRRHVLLERGAIGFLQASRVWHAQLQRRASVGVVAATLENADADHCPWPLLFGNRKLGSVLARELDSPAALAHEGEQMQHCVGDYDGLCHDDGHRIVALRDTRNGERATAELRPSVRPLPWVLEQLRGPRNGPVSPAMQAAAEQLLAEVNTPAFAEATLAIGAATAERHRARSMRLEQRLAEAREAEAALRAAPLDEHSRAWLLELLPGLHGGAIAAHGLPLRCDVAGTQYHLHRVTAAQMRPGETLQLAREPHNPHDACAIRVLHARGMIGYIPRRHACWLAARMDRGDALVVRLLATVSTQGVHLVDISVHATA